MGPPIGGARHPMHAAKLLLHVTDSDRTSLQPRRPECKGLPSDPSSPDWEHSHQISDVDVSIFLTRTPWDTGRGDAIARFSRVPILEAGGTMRALPHTPRIVMLALIPSLLAAKAVPNRSVCEVSSACSSRP